MVHQASGLQAQLDEITTRTRLLVPAERLAIAERFAAELQSSGIEQRILPIGATAPAFDLPLAAATTLGATASGRRVRSSDLLALGPLVVLFFRGRWDPYCTTTLEAWQAAIPSLRARGALLVAISPQLPRQNDFLVQQHGLTFPLLSDPACALAAQFGVSYTVPEPLRAYYRSILINLPFLNGDDTWQLPLPATFLISPEGRVLVSEASADPRVRTDPAEILALL